MEEKYPSNKILEIHLTVILNILFICYLVDRERHIFLCVELISNDITRYIYEVRGRVRYTVDSPLASLIIIFQF